MYENENIHHKSTCIRYANSQTEPHVLYKNGRRFNSTTLTKWMDFNTRERWNSHHQNDRVNQPNFGFRQRPGFFPSEVTYEFLYPKRLSSSESHKYGKTSLAYTSNPDKFDYSGRHHKDTNKHRRKIRRFECLKFDLQDQVYDFEGEDLDTNEYIVTSADIIDEDEKWSVVYEELGKTYQLIPSNNNSILINLDDQFISSVDFPIDYFMNLPSSNYKSPSCFDDDLSDIPIDHKAYKFFESPVSESTEKIEKSARITERLLCSIPYANESDFLSVMQQSTMKISQANLIPAIFLQRTSTSPFSVIYTYSRESSMINVTIKFTDSSPNIVINRNEITLEKLIQLISDKLDENKINSKNQLIQMSRLDVDALRGSLPLPLSISGKMLLVTPKSTDKQTAIENENLVNENKTQQEQWFDTTKTSSELIDCSICCESLTSTDAYQILPCMFCFSRNKFSIYISLNRLSYTLSFMFNIIYSCKYFFIKSIIINMFSTKLLNKIKSCTSSRISFL